MAETKTVKEELTYQRYVLKDSMRRGRQEMMDILPKIIENATEMLARMKDFSTDKTPCNQPDMWKWFQTYTDSLRRGNEEWHEASQKMQMLDALEASYKEEERKLFKR
jgi:hypothetical protein